MRVLLGMGLAGALVFGWAVAKEVRSQLRARREALHGVKPGANSREPVREQVIAVLRGADGRRREVH